MYIKYISLYVDTGAICACYLVTLFVKTQMDPHDLSLMVALIFRLLNFSHLHQLAFSFIFLVLELKPSRG